MNVSTRNAVRFPELSTPSIDSEEFSAEERAALTAIDRKVTGARTLDEAMDFLFEATRGICPCDRLGLAFVEEGDGPASGHGRVVAHWTRAVYEPVLLDKGFAQDLRGSSLQEILHTGRPRVIGDLEHYLREHPNSASTRAIVHEGIRSSMTCPLAVEGRPVGFLFRSSRESHAYDRHHVRLHLAIAERLSQAVEKAWRIEQLAAANRAYFEMLGFVAHELRSPLASLVMDIEALLAEQFGPVPPDQRVRLGGMTGKAEYLLSLIGDYLNLARIEDAELRLNLRNGLNIVEEVITPSIELVRNLADQQRTTVELDLLESPRPVQLDPSLFTVAMANLLSNAVKYGEECGLIRLRLRQTDGSLRISVWNRGPGFPPMERSKLFRKFSRLQSPELLKRKGTGVGLYTAWRIVQLHGGRIHAESEPGQWAEFALEIPQPIPNGESK